MSSASPVAVDPAPPAKALQPKAVQAELPQAPSDRAASSASPSSSRNTPLGRPQPPVAPTQRRPGGFANRRANAAEETDSSEDSGSAKSSSGEGDDEPEMEPDFRGNVKTRLCWSAKDKEPGVVVQQLVETSRNLELKMRGHLSTKSGNFLWAGHLKKNMFSTGLQQSSLQRVYKAASQRRTGALLDEPHLNPDGFLPAGLGAALLRDWIASPGVALRSANTTGSGGLGASTSGGLRYIIGLNKAPQVVKRSGRSDIWFSGKGACEFDPTRKEVTASAGLRLRLYRYNVTNKQDLKLVLGLDAAHDGKTIQQSPYFKIAENNWAVRLQRGQWQCMYEL